MARPTADQYPLAKDLRDRISFQRRAMDSTPDSLGGTAGSWYTLIASRACQLIPFRPRRKGGVEYEAGRAQGTAPYDCWVRYDSLTSTVTTDDQVTDARDPARVFKITYIEDQDRRRLWLVMSLELGVDTG